MGLSPVGQATVRRAAAPRRRVTGRYRDLPWVTLALAYGAIGAFLISPRALDLLCALAGMIAFVAVQAGWRECRFQPDVTLSPANMGQGLFALQLLIMPLIMSYDHIFQGSLPVLPSIQTVNVYFLLQSLAYVSYCAGYTRLARRRRCSPYSAQHEATEAQDRRLAGTDALASLDASGLRILMASYAVIGAAGFLLYYHGIGGFLAYAASGHLSIGEHGSLADVAGNFMRPFLSWAITISWCLWMERYARSAGWKHKALVTVLILMILVPVTFSYNRATTIGPILAVAAAYSLKIKRISSVVLLVGGGSVLLAALMVGGYRSAAGQGQTVSSPTDLAPTAESTLDFVQLYMAAPQFPAYLLDGTGDGSRLYLGRTLAANIIYPVPILGRPFRAESGTVLYNTLIYGTPDVTDQVIPFSAELFINFHLVGILFGFTLLGLAIARLQRLFAEARDALTAYSWFTVSMWLLFLIPGGIESSSQEFIYFFWPLYGYMVARMLVTARSSRQVGALRTRSWTRS